MTKRAAKRKAETTSVAAGHVVEPEVREEGPLAVDLNPPIPAHPRPGSRTIVATTAEYGRWRLSRVGLDLDDAIDEELDDYRRGVAGKTGPEAEAYTALYAETQGDVAIWEGERCLAVIKPRVGGDPDIHRFDQGEHYQPMPTTLKERGIVGLVRHYGDEACRQAILAKFIPNLGPKEPKPVTLTEAEDFAVLAVRYVGEEEAIARLHQTGVYGEIRRVMERLGSDAVDELRRIIASGELPIVEPESESKP